MPEILLSIGSIKLSRFLQIKQLESAFSILAEIATAVILLRKGVFRNIAKFTRKHLCHALSLQLLLKNRL